MSSTTPPPPPEEPRDTSGEEGFPPPPPPPAPDALSEPDLPPPTRAYDEPASASVPEPVDPVDPGTGSVPPPPPAPLGGEAFPAGEAFPPPPPPPGAAGGYPPPPPPPGAVGEYPPPAYPGSYDSGLPAVPPPFPGQAAPPRNNRALISLVTGIAGIVFAFCCSPIGLVLGVVGAVLGYLTRAEIHRTGAGKESENLALGGLITGGIAVVLSVIAFGVGASNIFGS